MIMRKLRPRDFFNKFSAIILSLLILISIITPLYVGTSNVSALTIEPNKDYYFYLGDADENFLSAAKNGQVVVRFTKSESQSNESVANTILGVATLQPQTTEEYQKSGVDNVYKVTAPNVANIRQTTRLTLRSQSVIPYTMESAPEDHVRIIFNAKSVDDLGNPNLITFLNPKISALTESGEEITITDPHLNPGSDTVVVSPYPGTAMRDYNLEEDPDSQYFWYVDIPKRNVTGNSSYAWEDIASVRFAADSYYAIDETTKQPITGNEIKKSVQTSALTPVVFGNIVYFEGTIPKDPFIYSVDIDDINNGRNYFYLTDDDELVSSKYTYPDRFSSDMRKIYVYNENWKNLSQIWVSYDYDDPLNGKNALEPDSKNPGWFIGEIPYGATVRFHPNHDNMNAASSYTHYPDGTYTGTNLPVYVVEEDQWSSYNNEQESFDAYVPHNFGNGILAVEATYFDYLDDNEISNGYLNPKFAGTNFNENTNNVPYKGSKTWFPFQQFNSYINTYANNNTSWALPLYFGNFNTGDHHGDMQYSQAISGLRNFLHSANSSQPFSDDGTAFAGLVSQTLGKNTSVVNSSKGTLLAANNTTVMPYFDAKALTGSKYARVFKSYFPFTQTTTGTVTKYSFNSKNAADNVYFSWDGTTPKAVNYGAGTSYGIIDGGRDFNYSDYGNNGSNYYNYKNYGIFPFNNTDKTKTTTVEGSSSNAVPTSEVWVENNGITKFAFAESTSGKNPMYDVAVGTFTQKNYGGKSYYVIPSSYLTSKNKSAIAWNYGTNGSGWTGWLSATLGRAYNYNGTVAKITSSSTITRSGNDNLDYGFGIRMDLDFRVNEYGTLNGTSSGNPITFEFSGDDDLWVYIDNELVMDLGGAHAATTGTINFKDMSVTRDKVANSETSTIVPSDEIWVEADGAVSNLQVYTPGSGNKTFDLGSLTKKSYDNVTFYVIKSSDIGSHTHLGWNYYGNWVWGSGDKQTVADAKGNAFWKGGDKPSWSGSSSTQAKKSVTYFNGSTATTKNRLDPNTTYHMTIFYMERGSIESNLNVSFTMTPDQNDLYVRKDVDAANVNDGFITNGVNAVEEAGTFTFDIKQNGSTTNNTRYRLRNMDNAITSYEQKVIGKTNLGNYTASGVDSGFTLQDNYYARFPSTLKTGSTIKVTEANTSSGGVGLSYSTAWDLYDGAGISVPYLINNDRMVEFVQKKTAESVADSVVTYLDYTNTPDLTDLLITKKVFDETGTKEINADRLFNFILEVCLNPEASDSNKVWKTYPFDATITSYPSDVTLVNPDALGSFTTRLTSDGRFSIRQFDELLIEDLPVGAMYRIREIRDAQYAPLRYYTNGGSAQNFGDNYYTAPITLQAGENSIQFNNVYSPIQTTLTATKYLDNQLLTDTEISSKFTFEAECIGGWIVDSGYAEGKKPLTSLSDYSYTAVGADANGIITFEDNNINLDEGSYFYKIFEKGSSDDTYKIDTTHVYYAAVIVTNVSGELKPEITYYNSIDNSVNMGEANPFANQNEFKGQRVFYNTTNIAQIDVKLKKTESDGTTPLQDVEFTLYTSDKCDDSVKAVSGESGAKNVVSTKVGTDGKPIFINPAKSGADGYVTFKALDYQPDTSNPNKVVATYYIKETKTLSGYMLDASVYKVEIKAGGTYTITGLNTDNEGNYIVKNNKQPELPKTGGIGVTVFYILGSAIVLIGATALVHYRKKRSTYRYK